jgi:hypothetical protein
MKYHVFCTLIISTWLVCATQKKSPLKTQPKKNRVDAALATIVAPEHTKEFSTYYNNFVKQQERSSASRRLAKVEAMCNLGKASLQIHHTSLIKEMTKFWPEKDQKRLYARCGVYEQFVRERAQEKTSLWNKVRGYARQAGRTVAQWVDSIVHRQQTA